MRLRLLELQKSNNKAKKLKKKHTKRMRRYRKNIQSS